jgi:hypothetical protein
MTKRSASACEEDEASIIGPGRQLPHLTLDEWSVVRSCVGHLPARELDPGERSKLQTALTKMGVQDDRCRQVSSYVSRCWVSCVVKYLADQ